jgi:hypothetical protein
VAPADRLPQRLTIAAAPVGNRRSTDRVCTGRRPRKSGGALGATLDSHRHGRRHAADHGPFTIETSLFN